MKSASKSCGFVLLALVGLCIAGAAIVFFTKLCPPVGPWPMPPWCQPSGTALLPSTPTMSTVPVNPASTETVLQFIPSQVDIYGRVYFTDPQEWIMNGNIFAFGPIVGTNINWVHELQSHGARAFSNISTWNSLMARYAASRVIRPDRRRSVLATSVWFVNVGLPASSGDPRVMRDSRTSRPVRTGWTMRKSTWASIDWAVAARIGV